MSNPHKIDFSVFPHHVGNAASSAHVDNWHWNGLVASEPHHRLKGGGWSGGGPFGVVKQKVKHSGELEFSYTKTGVPDKNTMLGVITSSLGSQFAIPAQYSLPVVPSYSSLASEASAYYATGYAKARPGQAQASMGQFLAELRDLPQVPLRGSLKGYNRLVHKYGGNPHSLPNVLKAQLGAFRGLGSEYLNLVFGWEPFVRDLRQMYNLYKTMDKQLAQLVRDNGRSIRRRATVKSDSSSDSAQGTYPYPFYYAYGAPPSLWFKGTSTVVASVRTHERVWFSGNFRYYIPDIGSSAWTRRAKMALFGANPSPELLWEILPWSWLIDWFSNVGDVMSNMSENAAENLVCNYSYIMRSWTRTVTASCYTECEEKAPDLNPNRFSSEWKRKVHTFISESTIEYKTRVGGGNPYGLNVSLPSLNSKQLGILAALGISRGTVK